MWRPTTPTCTSWLSRLRMGLPLAEAAWWAWVAYLHLCFIQDHLPPGLLAYEPPCPRSLTRLPAADSADPSAAVGSAAGVVGLTPPSAAELTAYSDAASRIRAAAAKQGTAEGRDALTQLSWHWNKALLDHAPPGAARQQEAARRAVEIAAGTWPYWLAWPETHDLLASAMGSVDEARAAADVARTRFSAQRWQKWWREPAALGRSELPQPRRLLPFASLVMLWDVTATAQRIEDDRLLTAAALRLQQYLSDGDASDAVASDDLNEELYLAQNKQHGATGVSVFEDSAWLRRMGVPPEDAAPTTAAFRRLLERFARSSAEFLREYALSEEDVASRAGSREVFAWANVHANGSSHRRHNHELSCVSGVYFTQAPTDVARLKFADPRGGHLLVETVGGALGVDTDSPPFVQGLSVAPAAGRLMLFPGWLGHAVVPSGEASRQSEETRVSFSFNLGGEWRDTASLALEM
eukprot:COSAG04_NODE_2886_length_3421_cov_1.418122_1_plen_466_part_00